MIPVAYYQRTADLSGMRHLVRAALLRSSKCKIHEIALLDFLITIKPCLKLLEGITDNRHGSNLFYTYTNLSDDLFYTYTYISPMTYSTYGKLLFNRPGSVQRHWDLGGKNCGVALGLGTRRCRCHLLNLNFSLHLQS